MLCLFRLCPKAHPQRHFIRWLKLCIYGRLLLHDNPCSHIRAVVFSHPDTKTQFPKDVLSFSLGFSKERGKKHFLFLFFFRIPLSKRTCTHGINDFLPFKHFGPFHGSLIKHIAFIHLIRMFCHSTGNEPRFFQKFLRLFFSKTNDSGHCSFLFRGLFHKGRLFFQRGRINGLGERIPDFLLIGNKAYKKT